MKTLDPTEREFVISILNRSRYFNAKASFFGTRHLMVETRLGYPDVKRFSDILGLGEPRKIGHQFRTHLRGSQAEALVTELLPELNDSHRERAEAALARVHAEEAFRDVEAA